MISTRSSQGTRYGSDDRRGDFCESNDCDSSNKIVSYIQSEGASPSIPSPDLILTTFGGEGLQDHTLRLALLRPLA